MKSRVTVERFPGRRLAPSGFTLVEVMVVVAILGVVMAISLPAIHRGMDKQPMRRTMNELREACSLARARAILGGTTTQLVFRPLEGTYSVSGGKGKSFSGTIDESLSIEMLDVNLWEFNREDLAVVHFYPNGTCDEFTLILRSEDNEWRKLSLEVTTALATVGGIQ